MSVGDDELTQFHDIVGHPDAEEGPEDRIGGDFADVEVVLAAVGEIHVSVDLQVRAQFVQEQDQTSLQRSHFDRYSQMSVRGYDSLQIEGWIHLAETIFIII